MFHKILLATDGSDHAARAAEAAISLAHGLADTHVTIMHVRLDVPTRGQILEANLDIKAVLQTEADRALASTKEQFEAAGVAYDVKVALGDPAQKIVEYARGEEMDLIVIGSRGRGKVGAMLLGSVSQQVAQSAHCPVMIVK